MDAGTGATGGSSSGTGGSGGIPSDAGTADSGASSSNDSGGCSCRVAHTANPTGGALAALGALLLLGLRRRRH